MEGLLVLEDIKKQTLKLYEFLDAHRALFSAHSVDFFLSDHWQRVIPADWRALDCPPPDEAFLSPRKYSNTGECQSWFRCASCIAKREIPVCDHISLVTEGKFGHTHTVITNSCRVNSISCS